MQPLEVRIDGKPSRKCRCINAESLGVSRGVSAVSRGVSGCLGGVSGCLGGVSGCLGGVSAVENRTRNQKSFPNLGTRTKEMEANKTCGSCRITKPQCNSLPFVEKLQAKKYKTVTISQRLRSIYNAKSHDPIKSH